MTFSYYRGPKSDHFDGRRFYSQGSPHFDFAALIKWRFSRRRRLPWPESWPSPTQDHPPSRVEGTQIRVSFIGHASFLVQTVGLNILIDPVWSNRAGPMAIAGPRRVNAPGVALDDLPPLDAILITHNHYDHFDSATLKKLSHQNPAPVFTPLGNDALVARVAPRLTPRAMDWGESVAIGPARLHLTPSYHWSSRFLIDRNKALWGSFILETPATKLYHIGDTGFGDGALFAKLRETYGPIDFAHIPIGAYDPRWFLSAQHIDPEEAVKIFQIIGARQACAFHWGTFELSDEPIEEPSRRLREILARENIDLENFVAKRPGETVIFQP